jgi:carbonic anhydrase
VLACADSRVPVELLFDQGIGDLFTVRVAGNVADTDEIGTVEYGVDHLGAPLIVVMGHAKCGAVTAVVNDTKLPPNIAKLVDNIKPYAERVKRENPNLKGDALIAAATRANVFQSIEDMLEQSPEIRELVAHGKVKVVGAVYDIHGGTVQWLGPHPNQSRLLLNTGETAHRPDEPLHAEPSHDAPAQPAVEEHGAHSDAGAPSQSSTRGGLLMPAAFLGGAGIRSGAVIYAIKPRATKIEPAQGAGATNA